MFLSCFLSQRFFFLNMILFFKKYNKEIITFLIWEHYHTTYTLGQLIWKCLTKLDTKLIFSIWKIKLPQSSHLKKTSLIPQSYDLGFFLLKKHHPLKRTKPNKQFLKSTWYSNRHLVRKNKCNIFLKDIEMVQNMRVFL